MGDLFQDKRFKDIGSDLRFKNISKNERKIKIDKRFQSVFTDKRFQLKYAVDIRGRPVRESQADNYKKYYDLPSDSDDSEDSLEEENLVSDEYSATNDNDVKSNVNTEISHSDTKIPKKNLTKKITKTIDEEHKTKTSDAVHGRLQDMTVDYARGIGTIMSDSSSDDSSSDESDSVFIEHPWGELDKDAETMEEATKRIALCNLDWDRIYAKDIMVLLHSFLPADGLIESVTIYPSEFGMERMKEEELQGPRELVEITEAEGFEEDDCDEDAEGKEYHREKLREYQLNRLKYYYAVVVFNNAETANKIYTECNGMEYESCAAKLDMRFISDDMTFDQEPREVCTSLPDVTKYKPRLFENSALRMGKVSLTWDETDPRRIEFNKRIVSGDINDDDLNNYIAGSTEGSEEEVTEANNSDEPNSDGDNGDEPTDKLSKYRSLIAALKNEEEKKRNKDVEMEISWGVGDIKEDNNEETLGKSRTTRSTNQRDETASSSEDELEHQSSSEEEIIRLSAKKKKFIKGKRSKYTEVSSPDEERKNAELDLLLADDNLEENKKQHFSLKGIQKQEKDGKAKKKKWRKELKKKINSNKEQDNFKVDVADNRFSALYTSHLFNIDPAHPQFKKTKAMEEFIIEKQKRRKLQGREEEYSIDNQQKRKLNPELSSLVSSIKGKTINKKRIT